MTEEGELPDPMYLWGDLEIQRLEKLERLSTETLDELSRVRTSNARLLEVLKKITDLLRRAGYSHIAKIEAAIAEAKG